MRQSLNRWAAPGLSAAPGSAFGYSLQTENQHHNTTRRGCEADPHDVCLPYDRSNRSLINAKWIYPAFLRAAPHQPSEWTKEWFSYLCHQYPLVPLNRKCPGVICQAKLANPRSTGKADSSRKSPCPCRAGDKPWLQ